MLACGGEPVHPQLAALRAAVADLPAQAFAQPSGCAGWLVRDLVCHLIIDAQDVLITLATPSDQAPTHDAVTYWKILDSPPTGRDPLDALIVRLAAAYREPSLLSFHLDDIGAAADAPPRSPMASSRSPPRGRSSPRPTTSTPTCWNGPCIISTSSRTCPGSRRRRQKASPTPAA
ncbi:mycothiol maleylpyruvate isomerase N-terminal domain protein [Mycobacteroides abscessus subsp. bolletii 1513]|uniref:Mycothiol maleylpyruvate isomerase N-terminal domain protein n=1 Tax=Mycobacteroides abscessus subsp. bolletii 1513 TaxID=1299321 RepID=X8DP84_9MYCO|nr:mycothiol maleylpyruvate isomerase N-terminal domain protein [Mycobacteroides abscessus subsp. bolletii 1513]